MAGNVVLHLTVLKHLNLQHATRSACLEKSSVGLVLQAEGRILKTMWSDTHLMIGVFLIGCHCSQVGQSEEE